MTNIWRTIDWMGEYEKTKEAELCPDDDEFIHYCETCLKPPISVRLTPSEFATEVCIPVLDEAVSPL